MSVCFELPQESENALAIKIKEQVFKKLAECKTEDELKRTLVGILSENESELDLEKIQSGNETLSRLDNFLACSLTEPADNLTETQIQLSELLKNAAELICNPPELTIPYPFPIFDLSDDFLKKLLVALLRLAIKILFSILKKLLSLLIDICNSGLAALNGYGATNIAKIINDSIGEEIGNSFVEEVFDAFGINTDGTAATTIQVGEPCDDNISINPAQTQALKDINSLLDDLSFMLTPVEVCSLLNGKANDTTLQVVEELLTFEYPIVKSKINSRNKIESLFKTLGSRNDPAICDLIEQNAQTIISSPELCFTTDAEGIRRRILEDKNIPEEEIKNQLQKERERNKANLEKVAELAAAVRTNPDKIFGDAPNIFCKEGSPGLFGVNDLPSFKESLSETFDATFDRFFTTYTRSADTFAGYVISSEEKTVSNPKVLRKFEPFITYTDEEGTEHSIKNSPNQDFMLKISTGQFTLCDQDGNIQDDDENRNPVKGIAVYKKTKVNGKEVYDSESKTIDIQTLVNASFKSLEKAPNNNIYILNTETNQNVMSDIVENIYPDIDNFFSFNLQDMSISLKIPIKYTPINKKDTPPDFTSVESDDVLVLNTRAR